MTISLCMIVKDEKDTLSRVLDSVKDAVDEIIIVDTGSVDNTKQIALQYTDKVYDFEWVDDFSKARNYSFSFATCDYIMWLDADDVISTENLNILKQLKQSSDNSVDCYMCKYAISFNENNQPTFVYYRERIVKNNGVFFWNDPIHEVMQPSGKIEYIDFTVFHKKTRPNATDRNLKIYEKHIEKGNTLTPRQQFYYSRELYYNALYIRAIEEFDNFLNNYGGWIENKIEACLVSSYCYVALNNIPKANEMLFKSFNYDTPRAEILSEIGTNLISLNQLDKSIYWSKLCLGIKPNLESGAFMKTECYEIAPLLNLVVAYYRLNNIKKSKYYNDKLLKLHPTHPSALHNKKVFEDLIK